MNTNNNWTKKRSFLCDELSVEDGLEPKFFFKKKYDRKINRKARQLCKQIAVSIQITLSGEFYDPILNNLIVHSVEPDLNGSNILVILESGLDKNIHSETAVLQALSKVKSQLRSEVAMTIHRKRAPELSFHYIGEGRE